MEGAVLSCACASDLSEVDAFLSQPSLAFMPARAKAARSALSRLVEARAGRAGLLLLRRAGALVGTLGWRRRGRAAQIVALSVGRDLGAQSELTQALLRDALGYFRDLGLEAAEAWVADSASEARAELGKAGFDSMGGARYLVPFGVAEPLRPLGGGRERVACQRLQRSLRAPEDAVLDLLRSALPRTLASALLLSPFVFLAYAMSGGALRVLAGLLVSLAAVPPSVADVAFGDRIGSARAGALTFLGALALGLVLVAQLVAFAAPGLGWEHALAAVLSSECWLICSPAALTLVVAGLTSRSAGRSWLPALVTAFGLNALVNALALARDGFRWGEGVVVLIGYGGLSAFVVGLVFGGWLLVVDDLSPLQRRQSYS